MSLKQIWATKKHSQIPISNLKKKESTSGNEGRSIRNSERIFRIPVKTSDHKKEPPHFPSASLEGCSALKDPSNSLQDLLHIAYTAFDPLSASDSPSHRRSRRPRSCQAAFHSYTLRALRLPHSIEKTSMRCRVLFPASDVPSDDMSVPVVTHRRTATGSVRLSLSPPPSITQSHSHSHCHAHTLSLTPLRALSPSSSSCTDSTALLSPISSPRDFPPAPMPALVSALMSDATVARGGSGDHWGGVCVCMYCTWARSADSHSVHTHTPHSSLTMHKLTRGRTGSSSRDNDSDASRTLSESLPSFCSLDSYSDWSSTHDATDLDGSETSHTSRRSYASGNGRSLAWSTPSSPSMSNSSAICPDSMYNAGCAEP
eukprot:TRINITY_DN439_c0_g1::TRINITY_DN439_c0_g1_i1::g.2538::m.2538 TRINITY_DN439_c0_g1::TRINITY_DN439_c0_g1_i1::g.2538  ORF type:complete len:372 (-),score=27.20 TRINITY_DN439_c0_g1_i1:205-1320(-)